MNCSIIFAVLTTQAVWAQTEPVWTAVSMPYFYDYSTRQQASQAGSGPYNLYFPASPVSVNDSLGCYWNTYSGSPTGSTSTGTNPTPPVFPYWYTGSSKNSGPIPRYGPAVGVVFEDPIQPGSLMKGISLLGKFVGGTVSGSTNPNATVFWSSDDCADGTTEYGFTYNWAQAASTFYYSYWSNCAAGSICYEKDPNNSPNTPVTQCGGGFTLPTLPASTNGEYYYQAFPYKSGTTWEFRAEVLDGGNDRTLYWCDINPASSSPFTCSSPPLYPENNTGCSVVPTGDTSYSFNPGWVYEVYGSVFVAISGGSTSPYVNVGGVEEVPYQISVMKVGK